MSRVFDKPIVIQKRDEKTELWTDVWSLHARVNKSSNDNEYLNGGAIQGKRNLTFTVRYFKALEDVSYNIQNYRIMFDNVPFDIKDYDDFMLAHKKVELSAESY